ncbi:MAG: hypothetical protein PF482_05085 [Desulfobacteraceae bacterium]|jgi:predicted DNA binding CopG/RHH family protein|nr:hypothetical protein [Desulfobacteraceae bacterium]
MKTKLDKYEDEIERNISKYSSIHEGTKKIIENIISKANETKSISLRLKNFDLDQLKQRAKAEGLPYQTLLSSIVHKFVTDQLVDKRSIVKSIELLKTS